MIKESPLKENNNKKLRSGQKTLGLWACLVLMVWSTVVEISPAFAQEDRPAEVSLQLSWKHQFQFAGYYAAKEKGFYKEAGLEVSIKPFEPSMNIIDEVLGAKATYGVWDTQVIEAYLNGRDIVFLANIFKHSPLVLAVQPDIYTPLELKGKKIMATREEINELSLWQMFAESGIRLEDLTIVPPAFDIEPFIRGEVDAMTIYESNEAYLLNQRRVPHRIINPSNYGGALLVGNLFSSQKELKEHPEQVRAFTKASIRGWEYALTHVDEIIDLILGKYTQRKSRDALAFEAREMKKMILPGVHDLGWVDRENVKRLANLFLELGRVSQSRDLAPFFVDSGGQIINFNPAEREYLASKEVLKMCVDPDFMPFEQIDEQGNHVGLAADYLGLISQRIGVPIKLVSTETWTQSLEKNRQGDCDIISIMSPTPGRQKRYNFSIPYLTTPLVAVARDRARYINGFQGLAGKTLALVKGYAVEELIRTHHKDIRVVHAANTKQALDMVSQGTVFATAVSVIEAVYHIEHMGLANIKIAGDLNYDYTLSSGFSKQNVLLRSIFNRAILTLTEKEKEGIFKKWIGVKIERGFDFVLFWKMAGIIVFVCFFFGFIYLESRRHNRKLQKLNLQLARAQKMLRLVIDNIPEFIFWKDRDSVYLGCNKNFSDIAGIENPEHIIGKKDCDLDWGEKAPISLVDQDRQVMETQIPIYHAEESRKISDGTHMWMDVSKIPLYGASGEVTGILGAYQDISQRKEYEKKLHQLAYYDSLTGLNNRKAFYNRLGESMTRANRYGHEIILFYLDIDKFKRVNDILGHEAGDNLLREIARRLTALLRETDMVSRIGGDEFTVLVEAPVKIAMEILAQKMVSSLAKPYDLGKQSVDYVSVSIGISSYSSNLVNMETLVSQADEAMYQAKKKGNCYVCY